MLTYQEPFTGRIVLVLSPDEAAELRNKLLVEMFVPTCIASEVADAIERELLEVTI